VALLDHRKSARKRSLAISTVQTPGEISERKYRRPVSRERMHTPMAFGKYQGLTLPQILFADPDFFWLRAVLKGGLATEAEELARRACRIRIPKEPAEAFVVEVMTEPHPAPPCGTGDRLRGWLIEWRSGGMLSLNRKPEPPTAPRLVARRSRRARPAANSNEAQRKQARYGPVRNSGGGVS
jgi:hypothetical protein